VQSKFVFLLRLNKYFGSIYYILGSLKSVVFNLQIKESIFIRYVPRIRLLSLPGIIYNCKIKEGVTYQ
jgi:hypothetical protein